MAKTKTVSYWTIAANPEQCRQDGQPIRTQDLLILAPKTFKSRFARTRFPAVCASRIDSLCDWLKKTTLASFSTNKRETATNGGMLPRVLPRLRPVTRSVWTSVRFCRKHCLCLICEY